VKIDTSAIVSWETRSINTNFGFFSVLFLFSNLQPTGQTDKRTNKTSNDTDSNEISIGRRPSRNTLTVARLY